MLINYQSRNYFWEKLFIALLVLSFGCFDSVEKSKKGIAKGVIEYKIDYPQIPEGNYLLDLMPNKMETTFIDGNFRSDIVAGMGLFKTSIISEKENEKLVHSVKMLNKKYASKMGHEEIKRFNPNFSDIEITLKDEEKEIAGYLCKTAEVKVKGDSSWSFMVYYTREIDIPSINQHTPFNKIDGVLMQYDIVSYDTHMRFIAEKVIPNDELKAESIYLEEGYEAVSPARLKEEIESIFAKVK